MNEKSVKRGRENVSWFKSDERDDMPNEVFKLKGLYRWLPHSSNNICNAYTVLYEYYTMGFIISIQNTVVFNT